MRIDDSFVQALVGIVAGGYFFFKGIALWRIKRVIENTPLSKVDSVAMGDAELSGVVQAIRTLRAPFSGKDCVYYQFTVEVPHKRGWRTIDSGCEAAIFYLDDGSGKILVNPRLAEYQGSPSLKQVVSGWSGGQLPGVVSWMEARKNRSLLGGLTALGRHRFTEFIIQPAQRIFLCGAVTKTRHVVNGFSQEENVVVPRASGYFLLSAFSEENVLQTFRWKAPLQIFGGMAVLLGCLWYVVGRF